MTTVNRPAESALVVIVPEVEDLVGSFRAQFDPSAVLGVPAHVTILYPFKTPSQLDSKVIDTLGNLFQHFEKFDTAFTGVRQLAEVLYLAAEPDLPFRRLTELVVSAFPETPPYEGQFAEVIPHLTVAQLNDRQRFQAVASEFEQRAAGHLPIGITVNEVTLLDNESDWWDVRCRFPLG
jgi:2'-5' RNA ligase